ncbi:MAG: bifunctional glutamate N-acetyltransferase/amino-acid acetyltransferase ArgJ [Deltaproteobacteria bacterium]|nr:bifunctional glutamate N-acetyltransferase/amino-acid acetyltransferase ArgJ [Deltaproteobacteria bacterium]
MECPGFKAAGVAAGLKKDGRKDLGIIFSEVPANVAGVFTKNSVQAACISLCKKRIESGKAQAIIANSGNANCCTGKNGMRDTMLMSEYISQGLDLSEEMVFVASTGVIGVPLPVDLIRSAMPDLIGSLSGYGFADFAEAVMTTDTFRKMSSRQGIHDGKKFTVIGVAKGSGMIHPDMATMLCFVCSDIDAPPEMLQTMLASSVHDSFNRITVDGDTSTNDMVLLMANGLSGVRLNSNSDMDVFQKELDVVLKDLARQIVKDGEGATKLVEIEVKGAQSDSDARLVADTVANSNLVKTAFFGQDANWGRIIAAAGRAGAKLDQDKIDIYFDGIEIVSCGVFSGNDAEREATKILEKPEFIITIDLNIGQGKASVLTCDFSVEYVKINADYRT